MTHPDDSANSFAIPVSAPQHKILFEHGGRQYRDDDPKEAINAMLSAASGKSSKKLAWSMAGAALSLCRDYYPNLADDLQRALGNGRYPETVSI